MWYSNINMKPKKKPNIKQKAIGYRDIFNSRWNNSQKRYNNHEFV